MPTQLQRCVEIRHPSFPPVICPMYPDKGYVTYPRGAFSAFVRLLHLFHGHYPASQLLRTTKSPCCLRPTSLNAARLVVGLT